MSILKSIAKVIIIFMFMFTVCTYAQFLESIRYDFLQFSISGIKGFAFIGLILGILSTIMFLVSVYYSKQYTQAGEYKKAIWRIPLIILILSAILIAAVMISEGAGLFMMYLWYVPIIALSLVISFSLLPSIVIRYTLNKENIRRILLLIGLIFTIFALVHLGIIYKTCNFWNDFICISNIVRVSNDTGACEKAPTQYLKDRCYNDVAGAIGKGNYRNMDCSQLFGKYRNQCNDEKILLSIQFKTKNESICDQFYDEEYADNCYLGIFNKEKSLSICSKIHEKRNQGWCYYQIAMDESNVFACDQIQEEEYSGKCHTELAKVKLNESICDNIQSTTSETTQLYKHTCYSNVAKLKQDFTICGKILLSDVQGEWDKSQCYTEVAIIKKDESICKLIIWRESDIYVCTNRVDKVISS